MYRETTVLSILSNGHRINVYKNGKLPISRLQIFKILFLKIVVVVSDVTHLVSRRAPNEEAMPIANCRSLL